MKYGAITGRLVARTAVHLGTGITSQTTDAPLLRNAAGDWELPGTTLGGVLRTLGTRIAPRLDMKPCHALTLQEEGICECPVCHLFGNLQLSEQESESNRGRASRLRIYNAKRIDDNAETSIRDGVGIDRSSGVAARATAAKFDLETIPAGTAFAFRLEFEDLNADDQHLLAATLAEWREERAWLGGSKARGLGAFALEDLRCSKYNLESSDGLMSFLMTDSPWENAPIDTQWFAQTLAATQKRVSGSHQEVKGVATNFVSLKLTLQAVGPMVSNDTTTAAWTGFDHAPALRSIQKPGLAMLHGSGVRGVLRSHAERIARTLVTHQCHMKERFMETCPACSPLEVKAEMPLASCDALLKQAGVPSAEEVADDQLCLACRLFGSTRRGSRFLVEDAPQVGQPTYKVLDFLAIDRFTGGALDKAKFDALVLWKPQFELSLYLENAEDWELGWLTLVLRDVHDGHLSLGFGDNKGFGKVTVSDWTVTVGFLTPEDFPGESNAIADLETSRSGVYHVLRYRNDDHANREQAATIASSWVSAFVREIDGYERGEQIHLESDSYFGTVDHLYDKEVTLDA